MNIHIHIHHHNEQKDGELKRIYSLLNKIHMNQEELAQALSDVKDQNEKAKAEIIAKIAALEQAIADAGNVTPAVESALAELKTSVQGTDDIVPDAAP